MKLHYHCPNCEHDNSFIHIIIAISPFFIKCQKCRSFLRITGILHFTLFAFAAFALMMISYIQAHSSSGEFSKDFNAWILFAMFFAYQITIALLVCNRATMVLARKKKEPEAKTTDDEH
jgi:hypothetical protein